MKKYFMIFGLALVAGIGVFALTDSMAGTDLLASTVPTVECDCETCGAECDCSGEKTCGDMNCGCSKKETQQASYTKSCSGGSAAMAEGIETKTVGCGCSKQARS